MKVVFIASLVHSGSTVLDLLLGSHPRMVGLGELTGFLDPAHGHLGRRTRIVCSCGATLDACAFWGPVSAELEANPALSWNDRLGIVARSFREQFGEERILVDSSKSLPGLEAWRTLPDVQPVAVHLIRDVRAWTVSMGELQQRLGERQFIDLLRKQGPRGARSWLAQTGWNRFRQWYRGNRAAERRLGEMAIPTLRLGYEELCLQPERSRAALAQFLEIDPFADDHSLEGSNSHVVLGNRMHGQKEKRRRLVYDDRWMQRRSWLATALLCRQVMDYNSERVYRNLPDDLWNR